MSMLNFFSRRGGKRSGLVMLAGNMTEKPADDSVDDVMAQLKRDIQSSINPIRTPEQKIEKERENIRKEIERQKRVQSSTIEKKMADLNLEKEFFKGFDLPAWRIAEHNFKQGLEMTQRDYIALYHAVTDHGVQTIDDLRNLDNQTRETILNRVIAKGTFLQLIRICQEIKRDAPIKPGIRRTQFIHNRMHKIFNP